MISKFLEVTSLVQPRDGFPSDSDSKECRRPGFDPWVRKIPWRRAWQPTPIFLPGESHDKGAWWATVHGVTESDTTEATQFKISLTGNSVLSPDNPKLV